MRSSAFWRVIMESLLRFRKCLLQGPNELYGVQASYLFPRRTAPCISSYADRRNQRFSVRILRRSTNSEVAEPFAFFLCEQPRSRGPLAFRVGLCLVGVRRSNSRAQNCFLTARGAKNRKANRLPRILTAKIF